MKKIELNDEELETIEMAFDALNAEIDHEFELEGETREIREIWEKVDRLANRLFGKQGDDMNDTHEQYKKIRKPTIGRHYVEKNKKRYTRKSKHREKYI